MNRILQKTTRGVTLVELMVVIALIAVIAAIASPGIYRGIERANSRAAAREVVSILRLARDQAKTRQIPLWVSITPAAAGSRGTIEIARHTDDTVRSCREFASGSMVVVSTLNLNEIAGDVAIREVVPPATDGYRLCYTPQGTTVRTTGIPLPIPPGGCAGEGGYVLLWKNGETISPADKNCAANAAARPAQRDARDVVHFFKIPLLFNGTLKVEQ